MKWECGGSDAAGNNAESMNAYSNCIKRKTEDIDYESNTNAKTNHATSKNVEGKNAKSKHT